MAFTAQNEEMEVVISHEVGKRKSSRVHVVPWFESLRGAALVASVAFAPKSTLGVVRLLQT